MLQLFPLKRPAAAPPPTAAAPASPGGFLRPESAATLLATPRRQKLLEHIWQRTSLSREQFVKLYRLPLERYAELVQQFPASESHHHAYPGGMLDHGLEIVAYALKLRQSHLLPAGASPEAQAAQAEAWTAGTAYAALLHDIGKVAVDLHVEFQDGAVWHPWHGPLRRPYHFRYRKEREYRLHGAATGLLYSNLLDRDIFDWLSGHAELWASLLYVLAGQYERAGKLGELVMQADQASVAQELGGDPGRAMAAPRHALQRRLLDGLRYLLKEELKLNQPQASDGWLTQDALWLVSKTVSDKLRAHLLSQGIAGIPSSNTAVFDVLQDHGIAMPGPDGKAIWRCTVRSNAGWSNTFTFLRVPPALIWDAEDRPAPFAGTVTEQGADGESVEEATKVTQAGDPSFRDVTPPAGAGIAMQQDDIGKVLAILEPPVPPADECPTSPVTGEVAMGRGDVCAATHPCLPTVPSASGPASPEDFMLWLRVGVQTRRLILNDAKALVHTVADTVFLVSPGVFHRYVQEHPHVGVAAAREQMSGWQWVQRRFEKLRLHRKQSSGLNIWTCEVQGPRKTRRVHGYLLQDPTQVLPEIVANNPYLRLADETVAPQS